MIDYDKQYLFKPNQIKSNEMKSNQIKEFKIINSTLKTSSTIRLFLKNFEEIKSLLSSPYDTISLQYSLYCFDQLFKSFDFLIYPPFITLEFKIFI